MSTTPTGAHGEGASAETYVSVLAHLARYYDACDRADFDAVMQILEGATLVVGGLETDDPSVIRQAYVSRQPAPHSDGRRRTKHHMSNVVVTADVELVRATAYYLRLAAGDDGGVVVTTSGRLVQDLVRDGERWRVLRHTIVTDL